MNETIRYGETIKQALKKRGMTQADLGEIAGWSQSIVSDLVRGKRSLIPPEVVRVIAQVLDIPIRKQLEILGYLDPRETEPGVAAVIYEDDPRVTVLGLLEGMSPVRVSAITEVVNLFVIHAGNSISSIESEGPTSTLDQPDSA